MPVMSRPSNSTLPWSGRRNPTAVRTAWSCPRRWDRPARADGDVLARSARRRAARSGRCARPGARAARHAGDVPAVEHTCPGPGAENPTAVRTAWSCRAVGTDQRLMLPAGTRQADVLHGLQAAKPMDSACACSSMSFLQRAARRPLNSRAADWPQPLMRAARSRSGSAPRRRSRMLMPGARRTVARQVGQRVQHAPSHPTACPCRRRWRPPAPRPTGRTEGDGRIDVLKHLHMKAPAALMKAADSDAASFTRSESSADTRAASSLSRTACRIGAKRERATGRDGQRQRRPGSGRCSHGGWGYMLVATSPGGIIRPAAAGEGLRWSPRCATHLGEGQRATSAK